MFTQSDLCKLAVAEQERDDAIAVATLILGSLRWTGDGYEWTGGDFDYRMKPEEAVRLMKAERDTLKRRVSKLESAIVQIKSQRDEEGVAYTAVDDAVLLISPL